MRLLPFIILISLTNLSLAAAAQTGFELDVKKPEPYENRLLRAEKSGRKKFTAPRRFFQNTYTHYNYFFNANNKLNEVIGRAKEAHKDDYNQLLPYYNYSLEATKAEKDQLDSIIYKAKTSIVMHDLRNDWIDDMYLLWGAAFFLQQEFDSAYQMFQFINYAFAPKEDDGYYRYIGSRMDGGNARSVVTPEEEKFLKRLTTDPPGRNTAFIWQVRTLTESGAFAEAGSLIATLRQDPAFPERLIDDLEEAHGYWFYKQSQWDSAAHHLVLALTRAQNKQEKARWEYLAAQLFERTGKPERAKELFAAAIDHTTDPVLDIWARLNLVRINKADGDDYVSQNIAELGKMARRERYADYRDVIYTMMARMELERGNADAARQYMLQAARYTTENPLSRNATYLNLANLSYSQKQYTAAASFYDSIDVSQLPQEEQESIAVRKDHLGRLVTGLATVQRQDSLQALAALPEAQRTEQLKKIARYLRRQQGLKEDDVPSAPRDIRNADALTDAFATQQSNKGEWYFYNPSSRTSGAATFKRIWGSRPNVDNWRRASSVTAELRSDMPNNTREAPVPLTELLTNSTITAETLLQTLPITNEQVQVSNDSIRAALLSSGLIYLNEIEDYASAIAAFEALRKRFPDYADMSEVLFRLHYAYRKMNNAAKAAEMKAALQQQFPTSNQAVTLATGVNPEADVSSAKSTKAYEAVYDLFLEGRFAEAKAAKLTADSIYQTTKWNPQLLYIEAVYHVKQAQDSAAIAILNTVVEQNPETQIGQKATTLIDVLNRRQQIEEELRSLQLDSTQTEQAPPPVVYKPAPPKTDTVAVVKQPEVIAEPQLPSVRRDTSSARQTGTGMVRTNTGRGLSDTAAKARVETPKPAPVGYTFQAEATHFAVVVLNKVDNIYGNEARNAFTRYNREKFFNAPPGVQLLQLDGENKLLLIGIFPDAVAAVNYVQQTKPVAGSQVVPWLKADKYSFTIISEGNLEVLKAAPDMKKYQQFMETTPVKL